MIRLNGRMLLKCAVMHEAQPLVSSYFARKRGYLQLLIELLSVGQPSSF